MVNYFHPDMQQIPTYITHSSELTLKGQRNFFRTNSKTYVYTISNSFVVEVQNILLDKIFRHNISFNRYKFFHIMYDENANLMTKKNI